MNREEILERNRQAAKGKPDERELLIDSRSTGVGMAVGGVLTGLIVLFSYRIDLPVLSLAAWSVYFAMFGSRRLYQFVKTKNTARLIQAVVGLLFTLVCLTGMVYLGLKK